MQQSVTRPGGAVEYVRRADGQVLVPSVVSFTDDMDYVVGTRAVEAEWHRPEHASSVSFLVSGAMN